ncbi:MAG: hypothetical protein UY48_C0005G0034 [Candidatus Gottesmanbacteria bacterium GW2011_GWB1_49_7]|uniref:Uncharacterized protein n=1 Tax=Candidatus Gottesmanbacteria bacterium GW2011_GWB1_49_7 TaxID=1618448 RepID=A0A0G1W2X4_9BACT|nr:MAG: hypothetical protein UY48_C0005G0034 [Candidatus Gottesmanbacteria bacterium GW2011_GWB1_49_7]
MRISAAEGAEIITAILEEGLSFSEEEGQELRGLQVVAGCWKHPDLTAEDSERILVLYKKIAGVPWDTSLERPERQPKTELKINDSYSLSCDSHGWTLNITDGKRKYSRYYTSLEAALVRGVADHAGRDALTKVDHLLEVIAAIDRVKSEIITALDRLKPPVPKLKEGGK